MFLFKGPPPPMAADRRFCPPFPAPPAAAPGRECELQTRESEVQPVARYILKRILLGVLTLFIILTMVFFAMRVVGGNPVYVMLKGTDPTPEDIEYYTHLYGFDRPAVVQYAQYLGDILHGDWGRSFFNQRGVFENLAGRWEPTMMIALVSFAIMVFIGIPLGILSATHRNSVLDYTVSSVTLFFQTVPSFCLGLFLVYFLAFKIKLFPLQGGYAALSEGGFLKSVHSVLLPSVAIAASNTAGIARHTRSSFLGVLKEDYIRTAKAKGLSRFKILYKHGLKNGITIISSILSSNIAGLLGGTVVVEKVFGIEGIGKLALDSLSRRDYNQQQACILAVAFIYIAVNILQDIFYKWIDPRVDYTK